MIFHTILFSLCDPRSNQYIQCLQILYKTLQKTKTLTSDDSFVVTTDEPTNRILKGLSIYPNLTIHLVPKPANCFEGMRLKYMLPQFMDLTGQTILYLDTDFLSIKPFKVSIPPDTLVVYPEGPPTSDNYCGEPQDPPLTLPFGCSAGFFAYHYGPSIKAFFDTLLAQLIESSKVYYSLDQPYFNRLIPSTHYQGFNHNMISFNGNNNMATAHFINCAGDPGDGPLHASKMLQFYLALT